MSLILNPGQTSRLANLPDFDLPLESARDLYKAQDPYQSKRGERKRRNSNLFTPTQGRGQPRTGYLSFEIMRAIYQRSEIVRAAVDHIIEWVAGIPWEVKASDEDYQNFLKRKDPEAFTDQRKRIRWAKDFFCKPNGLQNLDQFHRVLLRDLLIYDAAAIEKVLKPYNGKWYPVELGVIPGETIEPEVDPSGLVTAYWQSYNVIRNQRFELDECSYLMQHPNSWSCYGLSPIETAWITIMSDLEATKLNSSYFSKNGIPPALLGVMGVDEPQFRRLAQSLRQTSQDNPFNIHLFRGLQRPDGSKQDLFQMIPLSQVSNRDMQFAELLNLAVRRIAMAYKVSPSMIGYTDDIKGGIGSGVAETQENLTKNTAIGPLLRLLEDVYSEEILHDLLGWKDIKFSFVLKNTPEESQEHESDKNEVQMGTMTVNEFRSKWGGREPVKWGDQPFSPTVGYQPPMSPEQMQQQMQQQAMAQQQDPSLQKASPKRILIKL